MTTTPTIATERIDAHHHFWRLARGDYRWLTPTPALAPIHRDFEPADLRPILARHGIARTVLVQAADSVDETRHMLTQKAEHPDMIAGVVGWVDMAAKDAPETIAALKAIGGLVGIRPMIQDIAEVEWMLRPELTPAFQALVNLDLAFDALVKPPHLKALRHLLDRHPTLRVVVDHGAKPAIAVDGYAGWSDDMAAIAADGRTYCKLSGLVTEARPDWTVDQLRPYVERLIALFGADRLMWGSDWPVVDLARGYDAWVAATDTLLAGVEASARAAILGGTARRFYHLR